MGGEGVGRLVKNMVICSFERRVMKTMIIELRDNDRIASSLQRDGSSSNLSLEPLKSRVEL